MTSGRMSHRREQETDSHLANRLACAAHGHVNTNAQRFQDIGGAAVRTGRAVSMFGDARAGSRGHECRRRGNIEGAAGIAPRAAGVHQIFRV